MTTDQLNIYIDQYLDLFRKSKIVTDKEFRNQTITFRHTIQVLDTVREAIVEIGIATIGKDMDGATWSLTQKGEKIIKLGSWTEYLNLQEEKERLALLQINSSIRANESTILTNESVKRTNKWQVLILVCTLIVAGVGIISDIQNALRKNYTKQTNPETKKIDTLKTNVKVPSDSIEFQ